MFDCIHRLKRRLCAAIKLRKEFLNDYKEYQKWNYNNPDIHTKNTLEAKILRKTHILEKRMSLSRPKKDFA